MVQWQLYTLDHLMSSGFGHPFPRHGLQLLFWFANHCVTCEAVNFVVIMKLVSDCHPERGCYGFHLFGNTEELLPVLSRQRGRRSKRQFAYFEVGNLNTETYPESADLPMYVRENYGLDVHRGNYNIDRIIISYHVKTRAVEAVYVTEHDGAAFGRFSPERTHEVSPELVQALQSIDLPTFLTQMGYFRDEQAVQDTDEIQYAETSAQPMSNIVQIYSGTTERMETREDLQFFSEAFSEQLNFNTIPYSYDPRVLYTVNVTPYNSALVANYSDVQLKYTRPKPNKTQKLLRLRYWPSRWEQPYQGFIGEAKKGNGGGGISFVKLLLSVGALYLAAKCFSWLRSWWKVDWNENIKAIPWRTPSHRPAHIMLDYVY